jgi:cytochrome oxidase assembly protein ShyY1
MAERPERKLSKRERREARQRAARGRRLRARLIGGALAAALLFALGLWQVDRWGTEEIVEAEVIETRTWSHRGTDGRIHTHQRVVLEVEGLVRVPLGRADDLERGQTVAVRIRRGRLTGRPYFVDRETLDATAPDQAPPQGAAPLEEPS